MVLLLSNCGAIRRRKETDQIEFLLFEEFMSVGHGASNKESRRLQHLIQLPAGLLALDLDQ